jgi:tetratricopeptide (TPR) repeat protein
LVSAIDFFTQSVSATPPGRSAHMALNNRSVALRKLGDFAAAVADAEAAIAAKRDYGTAYYAKAQALIELGRFSDARVALQDGLDVLGTSSDEESRKGIALLKKGQTELAGKEAPSIPPSLPFFLRLGMLISLCAYLVPLGDLSLWAWVGFRVLSMVYRIAAIARKTGIPSSFSNLSDEVSKRCGARADGGY